MTYDAFDSMSNLMKHLSGEGAAMKSLDLDKLERINWESRYILDFMILQLHQTKIKDLFLQLFT